MEAICKKDYPFDQNQYKNNMKDFQSFLNGKTYKCERFFHNKNYWYRIKNEEDGTDLFSEDEFNDYFLSIAKMRKLKIKKLMK